MNKRGQIAFDTSAFSGGGETYQPENPNLLKRIILGIVAFVFLVIISPVLVSISDGVLSYVCVNVITCLFFKFIVPVFIIAGILKVVKDVWGDR